MRCRVWEKGRRERLEECKKCISSVGVCLRAPDGGCQYRRRQSLQMCRSVAGAAALLRQQHQDGPSQPRKIHGSFLPSFRIVREGCCRISNPSSSRAREDGATATQWGGKKTPR